MRIPEEIYKSVVYVGYRPSDGKQKLYATGFVVSVDKSSGERHCYLVTTRHGIVNRSAQWPNFDNIQEFRANGKNGEALTIRHNGEWWFHPEEQSSVDIAVCPFSIDELDIVPIPVSSFATKEKIHEYYIGPGDEAAITGLFTRVKGESKNMPVVRRGSVAMFPDDRIPNADIGGGERADIEGYLIEVRSVGGLSGSPVFVKAPIGVDYRVHGRSGRYREAKAHFQGDYYLLGLCHGHWEIPPDAINSLEFAKASDEASINLGIAIVVPAHKIIDILHRSELMEQRNAIDAARNVDLGGTTPD